jgi:broad specificity phosphatase PhoE
MHMIKLVRHGESEGNTGKLSTLDVADHAIPLSELGRAQAIEAGRTIGQEFVAQALVYTSPYMRTRETLTGIVEGAGVSAAELRIYEDPRLREVEHGYDELTAQEDLRRRHGWFYYRFRGGESPADCYDRTSNFLESMMRQAERRNAGRILIVTHGLTIRCFVMRFLHLTVEEFDALGNPPNCGIVTLAAREELAAPQFTSGSWGVEGLEVRT